MPLACRSSVRRLATLPVAVLVASALHACDGDDPFEPALGLGTFEGRWDGLEWRGQGYAVLVGDTLYVTGHRPDPRYFYDEFVRARVPFTGAATYAVDSTRAELQQIVGGDAGHSASARGELRVTAYDAAARRVRGTVQLTTVRPEMPWRFEGGVFDVPVYVSWSDVPRLRPR